MDLADSLKENSSRVSMQRTSLLNGLIKLDLVDIGIEEMLKDKE